MKNKDLYFIYCKFIIFTQVYYLPTDYTMDALQQQLLFPFARCMTSLT